MQITPKKSLGQNFLINAGILEKIVSAAELTSDDVVLEIGPGTGNLTKLLSEKAGRVIAVEKDGQLIENLRQKFKNTNVEITEADILKLTRLNLEFQGLTLYKVVGNIPYYITSNLLRTIFEKWPRPKLIVLTVQKEVAKRIVAKPPDMNLLALSVQFYSNPTIIGYVSRGSFRPIPKVDSAIIRLDPKAESLKLGQKNLFFKLIKTGFSGKRKQLKNTLSKLFGSKEKTVKKLKDIRVNPEARPEELYLEDWINLSKNLFS